MEGLNKLGTPGVKPASTLCPACTRPVYLAEGWIAADRTPFHKACLKCRRCRKMLNALTINEHRDHLFCGPCYHMVFMQKDYLEYTSLEYAGIVTKEEMEKKEEEERKRLEKDEILKNERKCPACDKKVWPINCMEVSDKFYHTECSLCSSCGTGSEPGKPMVLGPASRYSSDSVIYCQGCAEKIPKVTALSITEATTIIPETVTE
eukprot:TRINITY_DN35742_c0_g1_i1.p1 TRINITY_DN35742_c0_g1~~TRINITY_DN35742_c0_g1_i1.p1  ORF type:complete len:206 (-),score=58.33 TRINITY_DN35742_c0_g1_i1:79-696(-)